MSIVLVLLAGAVMLVGVVGTVVPFLPGVALIWIAGVGSWLLAGFGPPAWVATVLLTLLLVGGSAAKYVLPGRAGRARAVTRGSMLTGLALATVGFFVIPVVGFVIGGLIGVYAGEVSRTGDRDRAMDNTIAMLRNFGLGVLIEFAAAIAMIVVWAASVLVAGVE